MKLHQREGMVMRRIAALIRVCAESLPERSRVRRELLAWAVELEDAAESHLLDGGRRGL